MRSSSRFFSIAILAAAAALGSVASACMEVGRAIGAAFRVGIDAIVPRMPSDFEGTVSTRPRVALVTAVAFARRLIKRQRPIVMPQWRMCPSL